MLRRRVSYSSPASMAASITPKRVSCLSSVTLPSRSSSGPFVHCHGQELPFGQLLGGEEAPVRIELSPLSRSGEMKLTGVLSWQSRQDVPRRTAEHGLQLGERRTFLDAP